MSTIKGEELLSVQHQYLQVESTKNINKRKSPEKKIKRKHKNSGREIKMINAMTATSTSWFGARSVIAVSLVVAVFGQVALSQSSNDGCRVECYPNTKVINGKGGVPKSGENCRWILRTDGKPARLCDHIKCKKVCPTNQAQVAQQQDQMQETAASDNLRIEQQLEGDSPLASAAAPASAPTESMGIMRQIHGNKIAKAPVPGVAGGRLSGSSSGSSGSAAGQQPAGGARRMAPTLAPSVQYDENDTPPPISRFLDISPEE